MGKNTGEELLLRFFSEKLTALLGVALDPGSHDSLPALAVDH